MRLANTELIVAAANSDGEFRLAARLWNGSVRFNLGNNSLLMRIDEGHIESIDQLEGSKIASADVTISAPDSDWAEMLKRVPKPFFQDLMAAVSRESFKIDGDLVGFYPYYRATCRLIEIMRNINAA
ncbi:MAG TPA: SCP2 sterol-binding domain-containing protein [Candidatus Binataceae bacterium]|nr:SCP2 sterol-binding domain-containing protein [Candidatus Binataceae bacterium]